MNPFLLGYHLEYRYDHNKDEQYDNDRCPVALIALDEAVFIEEIYQGLGIFKGRIICAHDHIHQIKYLQ